MSSAPAVIMLTILIFLMVFRGLQKGTMTITFKKTIVGLIVTIVLINLLLFFI